MDDLKALELNAGQQMATSAGMYQVTEPKGQVTHIGVVKSGKRRGNVPTLGASEECDCVTRISYSPDPCPDSLRWSDSAGVPDQVKNAYRRV
ncbi:hypothetical protein PT974_11040 [Cladobotryum mycophilum]|uniref:Uncharacterized protein n=1 Tax=Cladobotryum mycophilum TaxID=491253 RepID=A0ABR0SBH5_9HYPO